MDKIAILDFGGQYAHLIANRVRRLGVYSEIFDGETPASQLAGYKGLILSGGPASVNAPGSASCDLGIFNLGVPILAICYGHQLVGKVLGGEVEKGRVREYGKAQVKFSERKGILEDLDSEETVWMSHFDQVVKVPEGFKVVGETEDCPIAAMVDYEKDIYCLQFHPEVTHSPGGMKILSSFVDLTGAKRDWDLDQYIERIVDEIVERVGDRKVFLMISGGVDSTVAFLLLEKALGKDRVYGLLVDTGLMRMNEAAEVSEALKRVGVDNLHVYDAGKEYFQALREVYEPEAKRQIIGDLFLDIKDKVSNDLGLNPDEWMLGQGTIYPDTIETGESKHADKIKTHHNRVDKIQELSRQGKVVEPLNQLYKDEVRAVGEKLGLEKKMVWRHPFPGPGLGVRILCSKGVDYPENLEEVSAMVGDLAGQFGLEAKVLPIKSVGVQGDERTYRHPVVVYGKTQNWDNLDRLSTRLTNQVPQINRALFGFYPNDFSVLDSRNCWVDQERTLITQKADKVVMDFIIRHGLDKDIWQFPTVLIPVGVNGGKEAIVLRPVESLEAMTANFYRMDFGLLEQLVEELKKIEGVSAVLYDITNKPPGTIEWE